MSSGNHRNDNPRLFVGQLHLGLLPDGHRAVLGAVLDVASVVRQAAVVSQALVLGAVVLGETPTLGDEDLEANAIETYGLACGECRRRHSSGRVVCVFVYNMVCLNAPRPMDMRKKVMEYIALPHRPIPKEWDEWPLLCDSVVGRAPLNGDA